MAAPLRPSWPPLPTHSPFTPLPHSLLEPITSLAASNQPSSRPYLPPPSFNHLAAPFPPGQNWSRKLFSLPHIPESQKLVFSPPSRKGDRDVAFCLKEEVDRTSESWKDALQGFFADKRPYFPLVKAALEKVWGIKEAMEVFPRPDGSLIFLFSSSGERKRVLDSGPWFVLGRYFHIRPWCRTIRSRKDFFSTMPVWIHLPNLPLHLWSLDSISRIASVIGKPLFLDERSANASKFSFVRVCIEVSADKPLPNSVLVEVEGSNEDSLEQLVEYESVIKICSCCKIFGHNDKNCIIPGLAPTIRVAKKPTSSSSAQNEKVIPSISKRPDHLVSENQLENTVTIQDSTEKWTVVTRKAKKKKMVSKKALKPAQNCASKQTQVERQSVFEQQVSGKNNAISNKTPGSEKHSGQSELFPGIKNLGSVDFGTLDRTGTRIGGSPTIIPVISELSEAVERGPGNFMMVTVERGPDSASLDNSLVEMGSSSSFRPERHGVLSTFPEIAVAATCLQNDCSGKAPFLSGDEDRELTNQAGSEKETAFGGVLSPLPLQENFGSLSKQVDELITSSGASQANIFADAVCAGSVDGATVSLACVEDVSTQTKFHAQKGDSFDVSVTEGKNIFEQLFGDQLDSTLSSLTETITAGPIIPTIKGLPSLEINPSPCPIFNQTTLSPSLYFLNQKLLSPTQDLPQPKIQQAPIIPHSTLSPVSTHGPSPPPTQANQTIPTQAQSQNPNHPRVFGVVPALGKSAILQYFNSDKADFQNHTLIFEPNQINPISLELPLSTNSVRPPANLSLRNIPLDGNLDTQSNSVCPLLNEKVCDLSVDVFPATCDDWAMAKNNRETTLVSEEEDRESGPPGFNYRMDKSSEENSMETAIHVTEETSSSDEEVNGFSSSRARMVREKLGISVLGTGNADKAFADFCRNRQKEIENIRKKSVVPDVTINLKKQVGKKGYHTRRIVEGGKKKVRS